MAGLLIALGPLACGSVSEAAAPSSNFLKELALAKGGQRLAALGYRAGEATQFRTLYDRQLRTACSFALDSADAGLRCTPRYASSAMTRAA
jgi:hypothetical protein